MTHPLPRGQQILLQRLMAEHTMTDQQAEDVFQQLEEAEEDMGQANNFGQCFGSINKQLKRGFGLEIVSLVEEKGDKIHAVVNLDADDVAKESFSHIIGFNERSYFRILLEHLVNGPSVRSTLINLRTENEDMKMDLDSADKFIETLLEEQWLTLDTTSQQRRRDSMNAKIQLGPRAFLELSHLLTDFGYAKEDLPQFVFHR